jgi:anaerobic ribonucleoside-triphosphate reductase activating protein
VKLRIARVHHPVTALGPGTRIGIWTQGCTIACPGCVSRDTWATEDGRTVDVSTVLEWCAGPDPSEVHGVTITGGEPSEQPDALTELVAGLDVFRRRHDWDVLCYTGVEHDEFAARCPRVPAMLDALVTGPYRAAEPTDLIWRGSANQLLIPVGERGRERYGPWVGARPERPPLQVQVDDDRVWLIGVPRTGDLGKLARRLHERGVGLGGTSWRP